MRVAVAGATGLVGRLVVEELALRGVEVGRLARTTGVDLVSGRGLDDSFRGADAVIDVSNVTTTRRSVALDFFTRATTNLLAAGCRVGVGSAVTLSIVGADTVDFGYYLGKRRQEELLAAGPLPWTLLRATQFHEFAGQLLDRVHGPVVPVPVMASQPVAASEVAVRLVDLVLAGPGGIVAPIAGPEPMAVADMARHVVRARGGRRLVVPLRIPGAAGRGFAGGDLIPAGEHVTGAITFADYLDSQRRSTVGR